MGPRVLLVITVFELKILPFFFLVGGFDISMEMQNRVRVTGAKQQLSGTFLRVTTAIVCPFDKDMGPTVWSLSQCPGLETLPLCPHCLAPTEVSVPCL